MPYEVYAIAEHGTGHVQSLGTYHDLEDIRINAGVLAPDVQITIEEVSEIKGASYGIGE